jgi:hypothetical protein
VSLSIYQASVPVFIRGLENLKNILAKGEEHAKSHDIDPLVLTHARLFPDMYPLYKQVYIATELAGRCAARLANSELPIFDDNEESFTDLIKRIDTTLDYLRGFTAEQSQGAEEKEIQFRGGGRRIKASGSDYLLIFILPNFYFHITTTYNLLRHNGVPLGKKDFVGKV